MAQSGAPRSHEVSIEEKVSFLRRAEAYGSGIGRVKAIETHMSWVFLAGPRAYKLKKPLRSNSFELTSLESRRLNCRRSVRLNRRLAGDVYVGTIALTKSSGRLELGGNGAVVDWLVEMRRLPAHRMLDVAIERHTATRKQIDEVSEKLATFYEACKPVSISPTRYLKTFLREIEDTHKVLMDPLHGLPLGLLRRLTRAQQQFVDRCGAVLARRAEDRQIVDAHGDLRPEHVCLIEPPVIIDCLEFERTLRLLDPADELAYLALECERLGAPGLGKQLLRNYEVRLDRALPAALLAFYALFRACLRAKIAVWHLNDPLVRDRSKWLRRAREYLQTGERKIAETLSGA